MVKILNQSVEEFCKSYRGEKFAALFCDAPYSLGDGKKGFMNKEWDNNIAMQPDTWRALAEHLLPGAFLFVFAGTLNDDLISVAMRQAGLRKFHKAVLYWGMGSGFPKASRIDTAIDRAAGAKRNLIGISPNSRFNKNKMYANGNGLRGHSTYEGDKITAPVTPLAKTWAGHRYGLQSLKPACETILIFQKNYDGKPVDSIVKNGSGALNIDGGKIGIEKVKLNNYKFSPGTGGCMTLVGCDTHAGESYKYKESQGRWPANLLLQHISLPVMRLTGTPKFRILQEIRRYFYGYTAVQILRERKRDIEPQVQCRSEILQQGMQEQVYDERLDTKAGEDAMPVLQQGVCSAESMGKAGTQEVLQQDLPQSLYEKFDGSESSKIWKESHSRDERKNKKDKSGAWTGHSGRKPSTMEGRYTETLWLRVNNGRHAFDGTKSNGKDDVSEGNIHTGASSEYGNENRQAIDEKRSSSSSERNKRRQQTRKSCYRDKGKSQPSSSKDRNRVSKIERGKSEIEVLACDIPPEWLKYFKFTGEDLGCNGSCSPECAVRELDEQSGDLSRNANAKNKIYWTRARTELSKTCNSGKNENPITDYGDTGGTSRFFFNATWNHEAAENGELSIDTDSKDVCPACNGKRIVKAKPLTESWKEWYAKTKDYGGTKEEWMRLCNGEGFKVCPDCSKKNFNDMTAEKIEQTAGVRYCAKASRRERNCGLDNFQLRTTKHYGQTKNNGSGKLRNGDGSITPQQNDHPTVKPISLCKYLATLLLPPSEYAPRRILIPFAGVASEAIGAMLAGWEEVVAIEKEKDYCDIGKARVKYWQTHEEPKAKPKKKIEMPRKVLQVTLF